MAHTVELVYNHDCPHVDAARAQLRRVLSELALPAEWREWMRESDDTPEYAKQYGSPTILVDGRDVTGEQAETAAKSCRVYVQPNGSFEGVPPANAIRAALVAK